MLRPDPKKEKTPQSDQNRGVPTTKCLKSKSTHLEIMTSQQNVFHVVF
jgi:hypothetical protein